ncbi:MAG: nucleoside-diphosphate kinase [Clostridia bacterium]|nr:nucleoside-diphosphate kinase [Clostridia bacterium]
MKGNITFTMIKPTAIERGHAGHILTKIIDAGFQITALKLTRLTVSQAKKFYEVHAGKPFFDSLVDFMSSGPIVAAILMRENAVEEYRHLIGSTDPAKAEEGSVRKLFGTSMQANAVHGSDSDENAQIEAAFFFSTLERFSFQENKW